MLQYYIHFVQDNLIFVLLAFHCKYPRTAGKNWPKIMMEELYISATYFCYYKHLMQSADIKFIGNYSMLNMFHCMI